jgi:prepilin-type processing-associated H-X9-DG protein
MRQLGIAMNGFVTAHGRFPHSGTWASEMDVSNTTTGGASYPGGPDDPAINDIRWDYPLSSWVVDILPFIELQDLADAWKRTERRNDGTGALALFDEPDRSSDTPVWEKHSNHPTHYALGQTYLALLVCPQDDTVQHGRGNLSYAVNGGPVLFWQWPVNNSPTPTPLKFAGTHRADDARAARNLGLVYPGSIHCDTPWDVKRTPTSITDGLSTTILLGENIFTGYTVAYPENPPGQPLFGPHHRGALADGFVEGTWANPDPRFAAFHISDDFCRPNGDCETGQGTDVSVDGRIRYVVRADWSKANSDASTDNTWRVPERINTQHADEGWTYLTSLHSGLVGIAMCDGSVRFLRQDIDGEVLAKLVSPAGEHRESIGWPVHQSRLDAEDIEKTQR